MSRKFTKNNEDLIPNSFSQINERDITENKEISYLRESKLIEQGNNVLGTKNRIFKQIKNRR